MAVLENQNKALIEELKSLKELYTTGESSDTDDPVMTAHPTLSSGRLERLFPPGLGSS